MAQKTPPPTKGRAAAATTKKRGGASAEQILEDVAGTNRERNAKTTGGSREQTDESPEQNTQKQQNSGKKAGGVSGQTKKKTARAVAKTIPSNAAIDKFVQHIEKVTPTGMLEEFDANKTYLPSVMKCEAANKNPEKNKFKDVMCLDATRVVLRNDFGNYTSADGDYIHANWVTADDLERKYIATQGPLPGTIEDFWRMTFQENATSVICLGLASDKAGFAEYWPQKAGEFKNHGKMFVNNKKVETEAKAQLTIYTLEVLPDGCSNSNVIKLIHCPGWADQSAASSGHSAISILRLMKESGSGTTIVHCSAGIGRTGTLIAIDMITTRLFKNKEVTVVDVFKELRNCRASAIQTAPQYLFIYSTVLDYIRAKVGVKFEAARRNFYTQLEKLI
ncbi:unnamed protein product, partial [Mesorhabditis spiculigera]